MIVHGKTLGAHPNMTRGNFILLKVDGECAFGMDAFKIPRSKPAYNLVAHKQQ
jgi:hypothetical protein